MSLRHEKAPMSPRWPGTSPIRALKGLWNRPFYEASLIVEQRGELRHFRISARSQQVAVRGSLLLSAGLLGALLGLTATAAVLRLQALQLERSHQAIYRTLLATSDQKGAAGVDIDPDQMLQMAQEIRQRNADIQRLVGTATSQLVDDNHGMKAALDASGLTQQAIGIIQKTSLASGGLSPLGSGTADLASNPSLRSLAEQGADNLELRETLAALPSQSPLPGARITSHFGIRNHPIYGVPKLHAGVDFVPDGDDRVYPAKAGLVVLARDYGTYGNTVVVRHDRGIETLYAHLDRIDVKEGQQVTVATVLGLVGNTGASTGKHLHFEISVGGFPVDPLKVLQASAHVRQDQN